MRFNPSTDIVFRHQFANIPILGVVPEAVRSKEGLRIPRDSAEVAHVRTFAEGCDLLHWEQTDTDAR